MGKKTEIITELNGTKIKMIFPENPKEGVVDNVRSILSAAYGDRIRRDHSHICDGDELRL